ncbi:MAG: lactate utilization protein [Salinivirgaceae bacterium]|nr:lactate utilization protein [Salinivirgaceae bacterium]
MILLDQFLEKSALVGNENRIMKMADFKNEFKKGDFEYINAPGFQLFFDIRAGEKGIRSALVEADFAIAETGSVVIDSSNENLRLATCLAEKLVVVFPLSKLVDSLHDVAEFLEERTSGMGGYVAFITGASRTADIERVLTVGVHGPKEMTVIIINDL